MSYEQVGRNCFNPKKAVKVGSDLEIWPGFYSVVTQINAGVMVQIDLCSKVFRNDKVYDTLKEYERMRYDHDRIIEEVKGMVVTTSYSKTGKHTYQIEGVDFEKTPEHEFEKKGGVMISFKDYYKQQYEIDIKDLSQPLLTSKDRRTNNLIYFIPELCEMTGLTDRQRANFQLMK